MTEEIEETLDQEAEQTLSEIAEELETGEPPVEEDAPEAEDEPEAGEEQAVEEEAAADEPEATVDDELEKKRQAYKERQAKRAEERKSKEPHEHIPKAIEVDALDEKEAMKQQLAALTQMAQKQQFNEQIKVAERELSSLESEFTEAYPDYTDKVNQAMEITKLRMVRSGMSEGEADELLRKEKVLLADKAAAAGKDPVEAVYNEATSIVNWLEESYEALGYTKPKKPKTNLAAMREAAKPTAVRGGKNASATKPTFDELEDASDIDDVTIGELMAQG